MIRVLVVHQTPLICSLISSVLSEEPDIYIIGQVTTVDEALATLEKETCNMILVAATLTNNGAMKLTETVAQSDPAIKVLIIGLPESKNAILQYVAAGASGYVLQDVSVDKLLDHVRAVYDEKALISPTIAAALMDRIAELSRISSQYELDASVCDALTPREHNVLDLIGEGFTNQEIADRLFIEVGTVKNHVHNILKKLDVSSREEAAAYLPFIQEDEP